MPLWSSGTQEAHEAWLAINIEANKLLHTSAFSMSEEISSFFSFFRGVRALLPVSYFNICKESLIGVFHIPRQIQFHLCFGSPDAIPTHLDSISTSTAYIFSSSPPVWLAGPSSAILKIYEEARAEEDCRQVLKTWKTEVDLDQDWVTILGSGCTSNQAPSPAITLRIT